MAMWVTRMDRISRNNAILIGIESDSLGTKTKIRTGRKERFVSADFSVKWVIVARMVCVNRIKLDF